MMSRIIHLPYIFVLRFNLNNFCRFIPKFYHSQQDTDILACSAFLCNFVFMLCLAFQATPDISETILRACIHVKQIQKLQQMIVWFWWSFQISVWLAAFCACGPGFAFYNSHVSMAKKQLEVISSGNLFDRDQDLNPGFPFSGCFPHSRMRGTDGSVRVWEGRREQHRGTRSMAWVWHNQWRHRHWACESLGEFASREYCVCVSESVSECVFWQMYPDCVSWIAWFPACFRKVTAGSCRFCQWQVVASCKSLSVTGCGRPSGPGGVCRLGGDAGVSRIPAKESWLLPRIGTRRLTTPPALHGFNWEPQESKMDLRNSHKCVKNSKTLPENKECELDLIIMDVFTFSVSRAAQKVMVLRSDRWGGWSWVLLVVE